MQCPDADSDVQYWPKGKCPPFPKFMNHLKNHQSKTTCLANALGWINNGQLDNAAVVADMAGLNPELGMQLNPDDLDNCVSKEMGPLKQKLKKCKRKYKKDNQAQQLEEGLSLLVGSKCMVNLMMDTCQNHMKYNIQLILDLFLSYNGPLPTAPVIMG